MTVTIHDVAKRAGVGSVTVSRVINNSGYASEEVRQRVLEAVRPGLLATVAHTCTARKCRCEP